MDGTMDDFQLWRWRWAIPRCRQQRNIVAATDSFFGETQRVLLQATAGKILKKRQKKFHYLKGTKGTKRTKGTKDKLRSWLLLLANQEHVVREKFKVVDFRVAEIDVGVFQIGLCTDKL